MMSVAVLVPSVAGVKVTLVSQLSPVVRVLPTHSDPALNSPAPLPVISRLLMVSDPLPRYVRMAGSQLAVDPMSAVPQSTAAPGAGLVGVGPGVVVRSAGAWALTPGNVPA